MEQPDLPDELKRCIEFHGHFCWGLAIGYLAAKAGLERLGAARAEDEELVAIVENDTCAVDAVQVLAGCTFGKGNLYFRDYGKMVFTSALRPGGRAVRVALRNTERTRDLTGRAGQSPQAVLNVPAEEMFEVRDMRIELPPRAQIRESVICERCGEEVMETRAQRVGESTVCKPCAEAQQHPERR